MKVTPAEARAAILDVLAQNVRHVENALTLSLVSVRRWRAFDGKRGSLWQSNLLDAEWEARDYEAMLARAQQILDYAKERL